MIALTVIHFMVAMYASKDFISKSEEGKRFVNLLESNSFKLLLLRSHSTVKADLQLLSKWFWRYFILGIIVHVVILQFGLLPNIYFSSTIIISLLVGSALKWGIDVKRETWHWFKYALLIVIAPWLFLIVDSVSGPDSHKLLVELSRGLVPLGLSGIQDPTIIATVVSVLMLLTIVLVSFFWLLMNSIILLIFILSLWASIKVSQSILRMPKKTAHNFMIIAFVITNFLMIFIK